MGNTGVNPDECKYLNINNLGKLTVYNMKFDSIGEVQLFLSRDPERNSMQFGEYKSETVEEKFAGPPLQQAIENCIRGYEEGYEQFLDFARQLESVNRQYAPGYSVEKSFVGQRPNVPAYVAGAPKTMYRTKRVQQKKAINICMNVTCSSVETEEQIRARGIITLNLIRILEMNNYIVNFRLFEVSKYKSEVFSCEVNLKRPGEKLNSRVCYYPMCGKGFVRRVIARIKESVPFKEYWGVSYGSVVNEENAKLIMNVGENDIYIGTPTEMNVSGLDIYEDADAFLEKLGIGDKVFIPKYVSDEDTEDD